MDKKKVIWLLGGVIFVFILLLIILWLVSALKPKYIKYSALEERITEAAKKYVKTHEDKFPTDNTKYSIQYQTLVNAELIKPMDELVRDSEKCNANVIVTKIDGKYSYTTYLNCGENYITIELYKKIIEDNPVVTSDNGLYKNIDGTYYFRGNNVNNYVAFGYTRVGSVFEDTLWQVLSISPDNKIRMRAIKTSNKTRSVYDRRYNINEKKSTGYNNFDDSVLSEKLEYIYTSSDVFSEDQKSKLVPRKLCIGPRTLEDRTKDGSTECAKLSEKEYYAGTITPYKYMRISTDPYCETMASRSCVNKNFIHDNSQSNEWTITPASDNDYQLYKFDGSMFEPIKANTMEYLYLVIDINEYTFYASGDGSKENPYQIKGVSKPKKSQTKDEDE